MFFNNIKYSTYTKWLKSQIEKKKFNNMYANKIKSVNVMNTYQDIKVQIFFDEMMYWCNI